MQEDTEKAAFGHSKNSSRLHWRLGCTDSNYRVEEEHWGMEEHSTHWHRELG